MIDPAGLAQLKLSKHANMVFCAACARRVLSVVQRLASPESRNLIGDIEKHLWSHTNRPERVMRWKKELLNLPEADADDSSRPFYYVMVVLGVIDGALNAHLSTNGSEEAQTCSILMINLMGDFDQLLELNRKDAFRIKETEKARQKDVALRLSAREEHISQSTIIEIQKECDIAASELERAISLIGKGMNW